MVGHRGKMRARNRQRGNKGLWKCPCELEEVKEEQVEVPKPKPKKRLLRKKSE